MGWHPGESQCYSLYSSDHRDLADGDGSLLAAREFCAEKYADLLSLTNSAEADFLYEWLASLNETSVSKVKNQMTINTRTRLANDAFLLKLPPPSRNCSDTFFERSFTYGAPYEWNKLDERVRRLSNFNLFKSEIKTVLFLRYFNS